MARRTWAWIVSTVAILGLAGCASTAALPSPTVTTPATSTPAPVSASPSGSPTARVLGGLQPVALTAISASDFWVLESGGCTATSCPSEILHTTDSGRTFQRLPAPDGTYLAGAGSGVGPTANALRFANPSDGWAFGEGSLWATHDGGASWHELNLDWSVLQLEPGANGYVYAAVSTCTAAQLDADCIYHVMRARADSDSWSAISPPGNPQGWPSIGVHGDTLWVMYFGGNSGVEWMSHDDGDHWVRGSMPCAPDLGGHFDPVSDSVIWAFCATGMRAVPVISTNGAATFASLENPGGWFWNGAMVAALSSRDAFVGAGNSPLALTTNGGQSYRSLPQFPSAVWIGFTDSEVGYVITQDETGGTAQLWRTTNAGHTWYVVSLT